MGRPEVGESHGLHAREPPEGGIVLGAPRNLSGGTDTLSNCPQLTWTIWGDSVIPFAMKRRPRQVDSF